MKKTLLLALLWLIPTQALHVARKHSLRLFSNINQTSATICTSESLNNMQHGFVRTVEPAHHFKEATTQNTSWFARLRTACNNFFRRLNQPTAKKSATYKNFFKATAVCSVGAGIGAYTLHKKRVCYAEELPLTWDEIKDPTKLKEKINNTPDHAKPDLAIEMVRYIATYLDSYYWRFALATSIKTYPEIAHILVNFLIQYPIDITQHTLECVRVVEFLISQNETLSDPIKNCIIQHKDALSKTTYGPDIIDLLEKKYPQEINATSRVVHA